MPAFIGVLLRWLVPPLLGAVGALFRTRLGLMFVSAMLWMGINFSTVHVILDPTLSAISGYAQSGGGFGGGTFGIWIAQWAGVLQFDRVMTAIGSAYLTRLAVTNTRLFLTKRV